MNLGIGMVPMRPDPRPIRVVQLPTPAPASALAPAALTVAAVGTPTASPLTAAGTRTLPTRAARPAPKAHPPSVAPSMDSALPQVSFDCWKDLLFPALNPAGGRAIRFTRLVLTIPGAPHVPDICR
jgi:hypothetical protein